MSAPPRYSSARFPPYRYEPGRSPHPRRDPTGHSYRKPEPRGDVFLVGVDLFNAGFFWESHEAFEALWLRAREGSAEKLGYQGLVQIGASELKRVLGAAGPAKALGERAIEKLRGAPSPFHGLDVRGLEAEIEARLAGSLDRQPWMRLVP